MKERAKPALSKRNTTRRTMRAGFLSTLVIPEAHAYCLTIAERWWPHQEAIPQGIDELEKEVHAMRKMILTGALFARLTRKDRLTLPYSYY